MVERPAIAEAELEHGALDLGHLRADLIENVALRGQPADETLEATHMRLCPESAQEICNSPHIEANHERCNNRTGCRRGSYRVEEAARRTAEQRSHL